MKSFKKIDIHAHVCPDHLKDRCNKVSPERLFELYERLQIERAVILPFLSLGSDPGVLTPQNARLVAKTYPERFDWFTTVDLSSCDVNGCSYFDFLSKEKENGAKGVGELTSKVFADSENAVKLYEACQELQMPVLFHFAATMEDRYGVVDDMGLPRLEKMLKQFPGTKFIGHAVPFWSEISILSDEKSRNKKSKEKVIEGRLAKMLREHENLFCDLSAGSGANAMMRDEEYALRFLDEFQDRIFYGSDFFQGGEKSPFVFASFFDSLYERGALSETVYCKIARENARRVFGLSK